MKKLTLLVIAVTTYLMVGLFTPLFAQTGVYIPTIGDTTDLKNMAYGSPVILLQYGGSTFDYTGGGIFICIDSSYSEGTHAFDHPWTGSQWVRLGYTGGEMSAFQDITGTTLVLSSTADIGGTITQQNDEILSNATDGDVLIIYNDDATVLGQFILKSTNTAALTADNDVFEIVFNALDDSSGATDWATIIATILDQSDESEDSEFKFNIFIGGTETTVLTMNATSFKVHGMLTDIGGGSYATANGDNDLGVAGDLEVDGNTDLDGTLSVASTAAITGLVTMSAGYVTTAQVIYPTNAVVADTNVITAGVVNVDVGNNTYDANDFIVLPALSGVPNGFEITIVANGNGNFELRTPATSNEEINSEDCDGTKEYLVTDGNIVTVIKINNTIGWVAYEYTPLGAVVTAVVPD